MHDNWKIGSRNGFALNFQLTIFLKILDENKDKAPDYDSNCAQPALYQIKIFIFFRFILLLWA